MNPMADLDIFMAVVKAGTIAGAARELSLAPVSVKKRLQRLERTMGVQLVKRVNRELALTEPGKELYHRLLVIFDDLGKAIASVSGTETDISGSLKVVSSLSIGKRRIEGLVLAFSRLHPRMVLQFHMEDKPVDFIRDGYDVAITVGPPTDSTMVARRLVINPAHVVAAPDYLRERPPLDSPADLKDHTCLVLDAQGAFRDGWPLRGEGRQEIVKVTPSLITDDSEVLHQWLLDGLGVGISSDLEIRPDLDAGRLVKVMKGYRLPNMDFYIIYAGRKNLPSRTRIFVEFIEENIISS